jgi:hypothetical protein
MGLINITDRSGETVATLYITGKEASFDSNQNLVKGSGYIQAEPGKSFTIVVTVFPSEARKKELGISQLSFKATRVDFGEEAKVRSLEGLSPTMTTIYGQELKIMSKGKLIAKNGIVAISLEGGHTLLLPLDSSLSVRIHNADFLLKRLPKDDK